MKVGISLLISLFSWSLTCAQQPAPAPTPAVLRHRARPCCAARRSALAKTSSGSQIAPSPISFDFFVSEAKVDVTKDEAVVRLAMAQHGSVLIELPANDGPRYIIPGDPEMATVDEKALESNKRSIIVRPGAQFVPPLRRRQVRAPAATVTAQMRSGLVVTFLFYPVEDLSQNVHRCVLSYNRDEVVARRRAAGLPVNLDTNNDERGAGPAQGAATLSSIAVDEKSTATGTNETKLENTEAVKSSTPTSINPSLAKASESLENSKPATDLTALTRKALVESSSKPKQFKKWTKPLHGVSLAVVSRSEYVKGLSVSIVGVRNTGAEPLKLLKESPELFIETLDDQGRSINLQTITIACIELSDASRSLAAGGTAYLAIAYTTPVLDAHQQVKITIAQTNAADEPASIALANAKH